MKSSLALALFILSIGVLLYFRQTQAVDRWKTEYARLEARALQAGTSAEALLAEAGSAARVRRRTQANETKLGELNERIEALFQRSKDPSQHLLSDYQEEFASILDEFSTLSDVALREYIVELMDNSDMDANVRNLMMIVSTHMLIDGHPASAVELLSTYENPTLQNSTLLAKALGRWAATNPDAAAEWLKSEGDRFPRLKSTEDQREFLNSVAEKDPILALKYSDTSSLKDPGWIGSRIIGKAQDSGDAAEVLRRARAGGEDSKGFLSALGSSAFARNVDSVLPWMARSQLSSKEISELASGLDFRSAPGSAPGWLDWAAREAPEEIRGGTTSKLIQKWAQSDYRAAGDWINRQPPGEAKNSAVDAYARALAPHDADSARLWADSLPPGAERDTTRREIQKIVEKQAAKDP